MLPLIWLIKNLVNNKLKYLFVAIFLLSLGIIVYFLPQSSPSPSAQLKIEDLLLGSDKEVKNGDTIKVHYKGTLLDGSEFDSSYKRNAPFETQIGVGAVIKGWDQGIPGMKVGGKRKLTIPPDLGYGSSGTGSIPPNSTLIFEVELIDVL